MSQGTKNVVQGSMPVAQAIASLREQLITASEAGADKAIQFKITSVELEMQLVLTSEVSGDGKLGWGVLSFGTSAKATDAQTHRLKLALEVAGQPGRPTPTVSGSAGGASPALGGAAPTGR